VLDAGFDSAVDIGVHRSSTFVWAWTLGAGVGATFAWNEQPNTQTDGKLQRQWRLWPDFVAMGRRLRRAHLGGPCGLWAVHSSGSLFHRSKCEGWSGCDRTLGGCRRRRDLLRRWGGGGGPGLPDRLRRRRDRRELFEVADPVGRALAASSMVALVPNRFLVPTRDGFTVQAPSAAGLCPDERFGGSRRPRSAPACSWTWT
jgi:hypothetical protein